MDVAANAETRLGAYTLGARLGVGGMAETFRATRFLAEGAEQLVCIKQVLPSYANDPAFVADFEREARVAMRLRHKNIVSVYEYGESMGTRFMALELIDGCDFKRMLRNSHEGKMSAEMVVVVLYDICHALDYAHSGRDGDSGVVHRDVSPANVLVTRDGIAKLADFGIAKPMRKNAATASATIKGTIPYMAPEQIRGEDTDARTDLFALGVMLCEALTGARPYDGAHDVETMHRILEGTHAGEDLLSRTQPMLRELVLDLLDPDPQKRPRSALSILNRLEDADVHGARRALGALAARTSQRRQSLNSVEGAAPQLVGQSAAPSRSSPPKLWLAVAAVGMIGALLSIVGIAVMLRTRASKTPDAAVVSVPSANQTVSGDLGTSNARPNAAQTKPISAERAPTKPARVADGQPAADDAIKDGSESEPATAAMTRVKFVALPHGTLYLDGKRLGRNSKTRSLLPGTYRVEARAAGHRRRKTLRLKPGRERMSFVIDLRR